MRSKLIILLVALLLLSITCCAHKSQIVPNESATNKVKVARILINGIYTDQGYLVEMISPKSPAVGAGMKEGDLLLKIDTVKIPSRKGFRDLLNKSVSSEREVEISLLRAGNPMTIRLKPRIVELFPSLIKLFDLVEDTKVTVAVVAGDISNTMPSPPNVSREEWKQSIKRGLTSDVERALLSSFPNNENFKLVDRSSLNKIMDEFKFNESGYVSDEMRVKLVKMYGVTHLIICEFSRFKNQNGLEDIIHRKLINVQTGAIDATDFTRTVKR